VMMLSTLGYQVIASTGNHESKERLTLLGATKIIDRIEQDDQKPLASRTWQAAVDPIGGEGLSYVLKRLDYGGSLALIGLTGGHHFDSTVFPFILRGANILGIDSVFTPMKVRERVWRRLATDLRPDQLHDIKTSIAFKDLPTYLDKIINHRQAGRVVIDFNK
ncbi:MAG: zinc-binding dehydrogenase, partial [Staphylococcus lugdunensis]|nr:zinc-binding dehydrogenase [Staphylococcus lugdunensis]